MCRVWLSVIQQDLDTGLAEYGDKSFDYVILNQTLQQVRKPDLALKEALRVGGQSNRRIPQFLLHLGPIPNFLPRQGSSYSFASLSMV